MALDQEQEPENDKEMSFFDHLDALRKHLVRSAFSIVIIGIVSFFFMDRIFHGLVMGPLRNDFVSYRFVCYLSQRFYHSDEFCIRDLNIDLLNTEMAGQFMMALKLAFMTGLVLSMPFMIWQLWLFLKPALTKKEVTNTRGFVFYITFLFACGICFGYFVLCPISVQYLSGYSLSAQIENKIDINNVVSFMTLIVLGCGLIFELPLVMYFMARLGLIGSKILKKYRKHAFVVILIVADIITPPDLVSQIALTIPLYSLYELGIVIVKRVEKQQALQNG